MEVPERYLPLPPSTCEPLTTSPEIPGGTYGAGTVKAEAEEEEMSVCGEEMRVCGEEMCVFFLSSSLALPFLCVTCHITHEESTYVYAFMCVYTSV